MCVRARILLESQSVPSLGGVVTAFFFVVNFYGAGVAAKLPDLVTHSPAPSLPLLTLQRLYEDMMEAKAAAAAAGGSGGGGD